jgi:hypothetical protein
MFGAEISIEGKYEEGKRKITDSKGLIFPRGCESLESLMFGF